MRFLVVLLVVGLFNSYAVAKNINSWNIAYKQQPNERDFFSSSEVKDDSLYQTAVLDFLYPQIVNANIGFSRLHKSIRESSHYSTSMKVACSKYELTCTPTNYKEKLLSAVNIVLPSEVMSHMIMRSDWGRGYFANRGANWFNLLCYQKHCGFTLSSSFDYGYYVKSFRNVNAGVYAMMKEMFKQPDLRIKKHAVWRVDRVKGNDKVITNHYTFKDFLNLANSYNLRHYDKKMFKHFSSLPLWNWKQMEAYRDFGNNSVFALNKDRGLL